MSSRRNSWCSEVLLSCDSCHRLQIKHWQHKRIPHVSVCRLKNMRFVMRMMRILSLKGFGSETDWLMWCRAASCVCGLHHGIIVHLVNTNTETITCQCWINNAFILCWKPRKNLNFGVQIILRSTPQQQICICCATFVYQNTSNNKLSFQSWSSTISCPQMKTREKNVWQIYLILCLQKCVYVVAKVQL